MKQTQCLKLHLKCTVEISTDNTAQSFSQFGQMVECSFMNYKVVGLNPVVDVPHATIQIFKLFK